MANTKVATHVGKHGDHPLGGALGAAVGGAAGAAVAGAVQGATLGTIAGVPGVIAGVAIGGVVGALVGKGVAQEVNPTTEDAYWNNAYLQRDYVDQDASYDVYRDAYLHGVDGYTRYDGRPFDEIEPQLGTEWQTKNTGNLPWDRARPAARDAYDRLYTRKTNV